ncbi:hypothetical protein ACPC54_40750 [Kitasatospora sp. NPDC094028]
MDFPRRSDLAGLGEAEYDALAAFDDATVDLGGECAAARTAADRLIRSCDAAERRLDSGSAVLSLHVDALTEAISAALEHVTRLEQLVWRYVSAYALTGLEILDRVAAGRPPLSKAQLEALAQEPAVGRLRDLLQVPVEQRYAARGDGAALKSYREEQERLQQLVENVFVNQSDDLRGERRLTREQIAAGRLSAMDDGEHDEPWNALIDPMLALARQTPYEISQALDRPTAKPHMIGNPLTSLRHVHVCEGPAETVTEGYLPGPGAEGERPVLRAMVCPRHDPAPSSWFEGLRVRVIANARPFSPTCGLVLDYRDTEPLLQAHAGLWLTPLTGLNPADHDGWAAFLRAATTYLDATYGTDGDGPWNSVAVFLEQAAKFADEDDLTTALTGLACAETATFTALAETPAATNRGPDDV